jgi:hypothetical protein
METAIILEGFKNSVAMHNLKYTKIIGDGDSSVYKKIKESMPYGPHCFIEKIECRNQIMRNYCNKIREIGKMPRVDFQIRNFLRNNILKFRTAVTSAIKYRKCHRGILSQKIEYLNTDILNSPNHIFGDYSNCASYFCKNIIIILKNFLMGDNKSFILSFRQLKVLSESRKKIGGFDLKKVSMTSSLENK